MRKKELLSQNPAAPEMEAEGFYAVSQLIKPEDTVICEIDIYYGQELRLRYFADADHGKRLSYYVETGNWVSLKFENAVADVTRQSRTTYWTSPADVQWRYLYDKEVVMDYLDTYSINAWEAERIEREVDEFGLVPDEVENWVKEKLVPEEVIFIHRTKTTTKWFCTACHQHGETTNVLKIGRLNRCPECEHEVLGKKAGVSVQRNVPIIVFQTNEEKTKYCEKQLKAVVTWEETEKTVSLQPKVIAIMRKGSDFGKLYYGQDQTADEYRQCWWTRNTGSHFRKSWVYPYNLEEIIGPMMHAERSGIDQIIKERMININTWLYYGWAQSERMEYLIKRGLYRFAAELMEYTGIDSRTGELLYYLRANKEVANRLKRLNGGRVMLEWLFEKNNSGLRDEDLLYLQEKGIDPDDYEILHLPEKSVQKICNYMRKNKATANFLRTWGDYLNMAGREGMDTADDIVAFPKNLKERHDELVRRIAERKDAERAKEYENIDRKIFENLPKALPWKWSDEKYTIVPAVCCADLMRESRELHHCVGTSTTYMDKMAAGRTWIFFLRYFLEPDKPYYTIELDMNSGKTLQWYSAYDRKPDEKTIKEVIDRWLLEKKERKAG